MLGLNLFIHLYYRGHKVAVCLTCLISALDEVPFPNLGNFINPILGFSSLAHRKI